MATYRESETSKKVSKVSKVSHVSIPSFSTRVRDVVRAIPRGSFLTYADVARRAGSPGAARAVGTLMRKNHDSAVPCHRVVRSDGSVGAYNRTGGAREKWQRLKEEGCDMKSLRSF